MMDESLRVDQEEQAGLVEQGNADSLTAFRDFVGSFENGLQQWEVGDTYRRYCDLKPEFQDSFWLTNISARNLDTKGIAVLMLSYLFGDDGSQTRGGDGIDEVVFSEESLIRKLIEKKIYRGKITDISAGDIIGLDYNLSPLELGEQLRLEYNQLPAQVRIIVREVVRNSMLANVLVGLDLESSKNR